MAKHVHVTAQQSHCVTGAVRSVTVELYLGHSPVSGPYVQLAGGPTGFEAFSVGTYTDLDTMRTGGWCACAGTRHRWDRLFIPAPEMARAIAVLDLEAVRQQTVTADASGRRPASPSY